MPKTFYIIDGHAQIYRAFFAPFRELTSSTGEPTKATFVFTQMLMNLVAQRKPDYLCMVIDSGDETVFRKEIYAGYKANRKSPPAEFFPQEQRILQIVRDVGVPIFVKPGFEADDLIATFAKRLGNQDYEIFLVSKDKDLRQVLNDCTKMYDVQSNEVIDVKRLEEKVGYTPAEAIEIQTLIGDAIDDVPGIPGVGEKTAVKLVKKYGSADAVMQHLDELTPKMRENFQQFGSRMALARQLVTLRDDVEIDFDPEACRFTGLNNEVLRHYLRLLDFTSLLSRVPADAKEQASSAAAGEGMAGIKSEAALGTPQSPLVFEQGLFPGQPPAPARNAPRAARSPGTPGDAASPGQPRVSDPVASSADQGLSTGVSCKYTLIHTDQQFEEFLTELRRQKRFAFDTETDALGAMNSNLVGMSFSWAPEVGYYVPVCGPMGSQYLACDRVLAELKPILEDAAIRKVGHNIKYDLLVMRNAGVDLRGIALDSMVGAWLVDPTRMQYGIDRLAVELLRFKKVPTVDLIGKGKTQTTMDKVELEKIACYAAEDADITWRLSELVEKKLDALPALRKLSDELETPLIDVLAEMEFNGISIDAAVLKEQSEVLAVRIDELRGKIHTESGGEFNIDSPKQLADVLHGRLGLKIIKKTPTGAPSTDTEVLDKLADLHPVPKLVQEYREWVKLKNTYLDNLTGYVNPRTRRVHGSFNQTGTETGRLSMSDPNLQNIPIRTDEGRRIRLAFVPGDPVRNVLLTADYSQIELRMLAHFTGEPPLVKAFEQDEDIHRAVAAEVFGVSLEQVTREQRGYAKTINFGIIYGVSAFGLARRIEGLNVHSAQELINAYNKRFPTIQEFFKKCVAEAQEKGYVETILGRRRPIPDINSPVIRQRNGSERMAINSVVQGSAADLIKIAMVNIHRRMKREGRPGRMVLQVHDELVFETPIEAAEAEAAMVREEMQGAMKLAVPLKVEVGWGKNWQEVK
ncbi:MAG TPA: DNA polymerase I [Tepidisphaeraceae bacterium]|nr:DNA polymerase I [Tepidisphaeraceae bacterium]